MKKQILTLLCVKKFNKKIIFSKNIFIILLKYINCYIFNLKLSLKEFNE